VGGDQLPQKDGQAGDAPHGKVVGKLEKVDPNADQNRAQAHKEKADEGLTLGGFGGFHRRDLLQSK
jgi:hypothetical protein